MAVYARVRVRVRARVPGSLHDCGRSTDARVCGRGGRDRALCMCALARDTQIAQSGDPFTAANAQRVLRQASR